MKEAVATEQNEKDNIDSEHGSVDDQPPISIAKNIETVWLRYLVFIIVPVFVLFYWRGTWILVDIYTKKISLEWSGWISMLIGYGGLILFWLFETYVYKGILGHSPTQNTTFEVLQSSDTVTNKVFLLLSRLRTYWLGFLVVNCWRGLWLLQDVHLLPSNPLWSAWTSHSLGALVLVLFIHLNSILAPPVLYTHDDLTDIQYYI